MSDIYDLILSRRPVYVWRTWDVTDYNGAQNHANSVERWSYEVPVGRLFYMESIGIKIHRVAGPGIGSGKRFRAQIQFKGQSINSEVDVIEVAALAQATAQTGVGSIINEQVRPKLVPPRTTISFQSQDDSNGDADWTVTMTGWEFDER